MQPSESKPPIQYPAQRRDMTWVGAEIGNPSSVDNMRKTIFYNKENCKEACDLLNKYNGYTDEEISKQLNSLK